MPSKSVNVPSLSVPSLHPVAPGRAWAIERLQRMATRNRIRGLARIVWLGRRLVLGTGTHIIEYRNRFRFICDCDSWYSVMTAFGILHREMDRLLPQLNRERTGRTFIDVGANAGFVSLLMASSTGKSGGPVHVHCFEPNPIAFDLLMANVSLNAFGITVNNTALGEKAERATLTLGTDSTGSSLAPGGLSYVPNEGKTEVEVMTLDDYCEKKQILPDVVKVDVEGHEPYVLQGGRKTLSAARPYLIVEINSKALREGGSSVEGLLALLADLDYRVFRLATDRAAGRARGAGTREQWNGYPEVNSDDMEGECLIDVVGVPRRKLLHCEGKRSGELVA